LSILEEKILVLPTVTQGETYIPVHPDFRIIFTSNPVEYAGVHQSQDALHDRLITLDLTFHDRETEIDIVVSQSDLPLDVATKVVDLVRKARENSTQKQKPTLRACIMIAQLLNIQDIPPTSKDQRFIDLCIDILGAKTSVTDPTQADAAERYRPLVKLIQQVCP
ncbi:MAG: gas vesicle protein GvpN, partial [Chloroflexota bacterium]